MIQESGCVNVVFKEIRGHWSICKRFVGETRFSVNDVLPTKFVTGHNRFQKCVVPQIMGRLKNFGRWRIVVKTSLFFSLYTETE